MDGCIKSRAGGYNGKKRSKSSRREEPKGAKGSRGWRRTWRLPHVGRQCSGRKVSPESGSRISAETLTGAVIRYASGYTNVRFPGRQLAGAAANYCVITSIELAMDSLY